MCSSGVLCICGSATSGGGKGSTEPSLHLWESYEKRHQNSYRDEVEKGSCDDAARMQKNRWCLLGEKGKQADLLTFGTVDGQKKVFYAQRERLAAGGACHVCYGKAVVGSGEKRGRREKRVPAKFL